MSNAGNPRITGSIFKKGVGVTSRDSVTLEQFKKALAERFEDLMVGYQEQPTDQDLNDLYEDFLESDESLDDYLRHGKQECNG